MRERGGGDVKRVPGGGFGFLSLRRGARPGFRRPSRPSRTRVVVVKPSSSAPRVFPPLAFSVSSHRLDVRRSSSSLTSARMSSTSRSGRGDDVGGVARGGFERRGVPVWRPRVHVRARRHEQINNLRRAAERRHVQRRRVHDERAVVRAALEQRLDHLRGAFRSPRPGPSARAGAAGRPRGLRIFWRLRAPRSLRLRLLRRPRRVASDRLRLLHASPRRLVDVRGDGEVQRGVIESLAGGGRAPQRPGGGGARPRLDLLRVGVSGSAVRIRARVHERLDHGAVHARGGGVHGAVPEPSPDDARGDEVGIGAALQEGSRRICAPIRAPLHYAWRRSERAPGPPRDAVDGRARVEAASRAPRARPTEAAAVAGVSHVPSRPPSGSAPARGEDPRAAGRRASRARQSVVARDPRARRRTRRRSGGRGEVDAAGGARARATSRWPRTPPRSGVSRWDARSASTASCRKSAATTWSWPPRAAATRGCRISRPRRSRPRLGVGGDREGTRQGGSREGGGTGGGDRDRPRGGKSAPARPEAKRRACASGNPNARANRAPRPRPNRSRTFRQQGLHLVQVSPGARRRQGFHVAHCVRRSVLRRPRGHQWKRGQGGGGVFPGDIGRRLSGRVRKMVLSVAKKLRDSFRRHGMEQFGHMYVVTIKCNSGRSIEVLGGAFFKTRGGAFFTRRVTRGAASWTPGCSPPPRPFRPRVSRTRPPRPSAPRRTPRRRGTRPGC